MRSSAGTSTPTRSTEQLTMEGGPTLYSAVQMHHGMYVATSDNLSYRCVSSLLSK